MGLTLIDKEATGKPIANSFSVSVIADESVLPGAVQYVGDYVSGVIRGVCQPMIVELWRGTPYRAIFPGNVTLGSLQVNNPFPLPSAGSLAFYSDDSCSTTTTSVVVMAGDSYQVFYVKLTTDYTQSIKKWGVTYAQTPTSALIGNAETIPQYFYYP